MELKLTLSREEVADLVSAEAFRRIGDSFRVIGVREHYGEMIVEATTVPIPEGAALDDDI